MKKKTVVLVIVLFALLVAGMCVYTRLKTTELNSLGGLMNFIGT